MSRSAREIIEAWGPPKKTVETFGDHIHIQPVERADLRGLPREAASVPGALKHVSCNGSREHVHSWAGWVDLRNYGQSLASVTTCSEPRCIDNWLAAQHLREAGHPEEAAKREAPILQAAKPKKARKDGSTQPSKGEGRGQRT